MLRRKTLQRLAEQLDVRYLGFDLDIFYHTTESRPASRAVTLGLLTTLAF